MKNDYIVKKIYLSFLIVSILTSITAIVGMLIDNIVVGRYLGQEALGAMGIVGPVSLVFSAVGNICSGGGGARAAQALGRGERDKVCLVFTVNVLFVLVIGGLITILGILFTPQIAVLLGAKGDLFEPSCRYLYGYFLGAIPTIMLTAMMSFVKIDGSPKMPLVCIAVMSSSNIILDFAMVKMGMFGMALATTISYCLALATVFLHFLKKTSSLKLVKPKKLFSETSQMVVTGFPTAISRISDTIKVMLLNNMMVAFVSVAAVTALNVRTQANNFLSAVIIGVGQAATPTISMFFGEEDRTAIKDTLKITLKFGLFMTLLLMMVLFIFPGIFPEIFGVTEPEIMSMASMAIRIFSITIPFTLINTVLLNFYQCTKRTGMATLICLLQSLVYTVIFAFILIRPFGANGIWTAFFLGEVFTLVTVIVCIFVKNKKISLTLSSIMMLDKDFGGNENDRLELSIGNSMDEVMTISSGIYKFGKNRDIDDKTLNILSLCIEEIAGNVVRHSFKEGEKRWLDLIILDRKDHMIIRFRDNGPAFDPVAYLNNDAPKEGYGISLIHFFADDFEYRYNMGINNTIIHLKKHNIKVK